MSAPTPRSARLLRSPAVLRDGQWWLASRAGAILATDPGFTGALDRFATAAAAADRAVAELRSRQGGSPVSEDGGWR
ncbi:hypothetical protein [Streptacidiphilus anmyonensis]|uniref:hypothetical protein n=1 Tax=Streptacidiphilus anmyonensis TaxID=405782 RepID=UPI0005AA5191|nr:hypothetical protein [Streptacidiphilus anmyonensis]